MKFKKNRKFIKPITDENAIKVQLDGKTFMTISRLSSLEVWLKRYPEAKVLAA